MFRALLISLLKQFKFHAIKLLLTSITVFNHHHITTLKLVTEVYSNMKLMPQAASYRHKPISKFITIIHLMLHSFIFIITKAEERKRIAKQFLQGVLQVDKPSLLLLFLDLLVFRFHSHLFFHLRQDSYYICDQLLLNL